MQTLRPYCDVIIYLLLLSYGAVLGEKAITKAYLSIAHTAKVMNASGSFLGESQHNHSQELALLYLDAILEFQADQAPNSEQEKPTKPDQQLKYFNEVPAEVDILAKPVHTLLTISAHLPLVYPRISSPPPKRLKV